MAHEVLARKWRPQKFEDLVGQEHIRRTLTQSLESGQFGQAYLFAGPRGTGKTSTARILAKALNCEQGTSPTPCNKCKFCISITNGLNFDVIEIDAASNRGIDEIRGLRENVKFAPSSNRFKVYIIDEVHMLTNEAFNALLKTLEEPPKHVVFIMATTEVHKIPETIISRTQRFDFKRIDDGSLRDRLKTIVETENIPIDEDEKDEIISTLVKYSRGGLRDAQNALEQVKSYASDKITVEDLNNVLSIVKDETLFQISEMVAKGQTDELLQLLDTIILSGKDMQHFTRDLAEHFRKLMICKTSKNPSDMLGLGEGAIKEYVSQSAIFDVNRLLHSIRILVKTEEDLFKGAQSRIVLEMALIQLARLPETMDITKIIRKLDSLQSGTPAAAQAANKPFSAADVKKNDSSRINAPAKPVTAEKSPKKAEAAPVVTGDQWQQLLALLSGESMFLKHAITSGGHEGPKDGILKIFLPDDSSVIFNKLEDRQSKEFMAVKDAVNTVYGGGVNMEFGLVSNGSSKVNGRNTAVGAGDGNTPGKAVTGGDEPQIIENAIKKFNASIVR